MALQIITHPYISHRRFAMKTGLTQMLKELRLVFGDPYRQRDDPCHTQPWLKVKEKSPVLESKLLHPSTNTGVKLMTNKTSQLFDQAELEIYLLRVVRILIETIVRTNPKQAGVLSELLQKEYLTLQQSGSLKLAKAFELLYRIEGGLEGRQLLTDLDNNGHPH